MAEIVSDKVFFKSIWKILPPLRLKKNEINK